MYTYAVTLRVQVLVGVVARQRTAEGWESEPLDKDHKGDGASLDLA